MYHTTRILARTDVAALLSLEECIGAVEDAFRDHAEGRSLGNGVLGFPVPGGGFHIKAAGLAGEAPIFATKVNGNFFGNAPLGMPRIQGLIVLCDAQNGYPLAVMDSTYITLVRTGAASGVAARHLALKDADSVTIAGCGVQGRIQLRAVCAVRPIARACAYDADPAVADTFAREMSAELSHDVRAVRDLAAATRQSAIVVTCTPAREAILQLGDVGPGTFIAAVGADSEEKQEIAPALLAASAVVPDLLDQAAAFGDLHHALTSGAMRRDEVRGELGAIIAGRAEGRRHDDEIVVFDSTGTALQDAAAAALVYRRACRDDRGTALDLLRPPPR
jgi:ornithine cyclodeaminase/alanine dehydrogenase-like protein (mu-crystallin family)